MMQPPRFNSTLVRLKAALPPMIETMDLVFQFHTGSIKSAQYLITQRLLYSVSIPHWFD